MSISTPFRKGLDAAITWCGDTRGAGETALRILHHARGDVSIPDELDGFAHGLEVVAEEIRLIAEQARLQINKVTP